MQHVKRELAGEYGNALLRATDKRHIGAVLSGQTFPQLGSKRCTFVAVGAVGVQCIRRFHKTVERCNDAAGGHERVFHRCAQPFEVGALADIHTPVRVGIQHMQRIEFSTGADETVAISKIGLILRELIILVCAQRHHRHVENVVKPKSRRGHFLAVFVCFPEKVCLLLGL